MGRRLGFFKAELDASLALKCTPLLFRSRKCLTLASISGEGLTKGDGGMFRFGVGGSVRDWIVERVAVYGDAGASDNPGSFAAVGPT